MHHQMKKRKAHTNDIRSIHEKIDAVSSQLTVYYIDTLFNSCISLVFHRDTHTHNTNLYTCSLYALSSRKIQMVCKIKYNKTMDPDETCDWIIRKNASAVKSLDEKKYLDEAYELLDEQSMKLHNKVLSYIEMGSGCFIHSIVYVSDTVSLYFVMIR